MPIATNPMELPRVDNPFGDQNIWQIRQLVEKVVCAWGNREIVEKIMKDACPFQLLDSAKTKLHYIKLSKFNTPTHPLYLKGDLSPSKY